MRTYSHALLTLAATRHSQPEDYSLAVWSTVGAVTPDIPTGIDATWLWAHQLRYSRQDFLKEVCGRNAFRRSDAALHSTLPVAVVLLLYAALRAERYDRRKAVLSFLLGWAGHVTADILAHGADARPLLWPLSEWRFESPVSYRERERYGKVVTLVEHTVLLMVVARLRFRRRGAVCFRGPAQANGV